jgi:hypothetical protein
VGPVSAGFAVTAGSGGAHGTTDRLPRQRSDCEYFHDHEVFLALWHQEHFVIMTWAAITATFSRIRQRDRDRPLNGIVTRRLLIRGKPGGVIMPRTLHSRLHSRLLPAGRWTLTYRNH